VTTRARKLSLTTIIGFIAIALASSATAYFSTLGSGTGSASTGTLNAPGAPTFLQDSETSVTVSWTAPAESVAVEYYRVFRTGSANFVCQASGTSTSCPDGTIAPSTFYTYTVTAYSGSWTATSASADFTTAAPAPAPGAPVITFPTATSYTTAAAWDAGCPSPGFCGTAAAADGQTLAEVQFSLKQGSTWWNGTDFTGATEQYHDMTGTTAWAQAFAFPPVGSYVLNVKAIDGRPVESAVTSVAFSIGTEAPAVQSFSVELAAAGTKTAGTAFDIELTAMSDATVLTSYTGSKTIDFSGPATSPGGTAPTYPAAVTFTNGIGTATVTLTKAEAIALSAADGARTGAVNVTVNAGSAARLALTNTTPASPICLWTCTFTNANNMEFIAKVRVTDSYGNTVQNLGSGHQATATATAGSFTGSTTVTIPSTGSAETTTNITYRARSGGGSTWTETLTVSTSAGTTYTQATATFVK
jgi:hypothetical protein